jgi:hypothetical protein
MRLESVTTMNILPRLLTFRRNLLPSLSGSYFVHFISIPVHFPPPLAFTISIYLTSQCHSFLLFSLQLRSSHFLCHNQFLNAQLTVYSEDGGAIVLRNVFKDLLDHTMPHSGRY